MVQEASLDTLALAGAMAASLFAGLTFCIPVLNSQFERDFYRDRPRVGEEDRL